jgi:outer membrane lipoprotein carrier protein
VTRTFFAIGVLIAAAALASPAEIDRAAAATSGMEAQFTHRFTPKGFKTAQVESGTVVFGQLPSMRWTYSKPEEKVFVFNGARSWFYVPADRQVTVADVDDQRKRDVPFLLIGDAAARDRNFVIREKRQGRGIVTTLQPRDATAVIRTVSITSDAGTHLIDAIEYADREGNRTLFTFTGYHRAGGKADTFTFVTPPGVQVIRAE